EDSILPLEYEAMSSRVHMLPLSWHRYAVGITNIFGCHGEAAPKSCIASRLSRSGRERAAFVSESQNLARVVAAGYEGTDRPEEGIELGGPARREVDPEDAWVVIPEDQALSGFVAHAQKLAQVPPQLFDAGFGAQERGPTVAPSSIDEKPCEAILALQLYEI